MLRRFLPILLLPVAALSGDVERGFDLSKYELRPAYANEFDTPERMVREDDLCALGANGKWTRVAMPPADAEWIVEGTGGVAIRDGRLCLAPSPFDGAGLPRVVPEAERSHLVVWNRRVFPENFLFEVEMDPLDSTSGLAIVFFCAAGTHGADIFDLALPPRRADYRTYHSGALTNYSDSFWSRNTEVEGASNRLRKNPGFNQVADGMSLTETRGPFRLRLLKDQAHVEVEIDGQVVLRWDDPEKPLGAGRIGLRSMPGVTQIAFDHFKVWELIAKLNPPPI